MSYNITNIRIESGTVGPFTPEEAAVLRAWGRDNERFLPEMNFIEEHFEDTEGAVGVLRTLRWTGMWSGHSYDEFVKLLPLVPGEFTLFVTWEGGDSFTRIRKTPDGTVTSERA